MQSNSFFKNNWFMLTMVLGMVAGAITGWVWPGATALEPLGTIFINMMFCVVVPLVFFSISSAVANMVSARKAGKVMGTTVVTFLCTAAIAAVIMYIIVRVINIVPSGFEAIDRPKTRGDDGLPVAIELREVRIEALLLRRFLYLCLESHGFTIVATFLFRFQHSLQHMTLVGLLEHIDASRMTMSRSHRNIITIPCDAGVIIFFFCVE